jgi:hypothetical protein
MPVCSLRGGTGLQNRGLPQLTSQARSSKFVSEPEVFMNRAAPSIIVFAMASLAAYGQAAQSPAAPAQPAPAQPGAISPFSPSLSPAPGIDVVPGAPPVVGQSPGTFVPGVGAVPGTPAPGIGIVPGGAPIIGQPPGTGLPAAEAFPGTPAPGTGLVPGGPPIIGQPPGTGLPAAEAFPGTPAPGTGIVPGGPPIIGQPPGTGLPAAEGFPGTPAPGTGIQPGVPPVGVAPGQFGFGTGVAAPGFDPRFPAGAAPGAMAPPGVGMPPGATQPWIGSRETRPAIPQNVLPGTHITPAQLQNINRLSGALLRVGLPTIDLIDQQWELLEVLQDAAVSPVRPRQESVMELARNLSTILPMLRLTAQERGQLAVDINMILNGANLPPNAAERVLADARSILHGQGRGPRPGADLLLNNLQTILAEVQPEHGAPGVTGADGTLDAPLPPPRPR